MKDGNQAEMDNIAFKYSDKKDAKFLLGAYRSEKNQLAWILGETPRRYQKMITFIVSKNACLILL